MLGSAPLMAFMPVTDVGVARRPSESTLGLRVLDESPFALVVDADGTKVRITPAPDFRPQPFTIAGWEVPDIGAAVEKLATLGVVFNRYDGMDQESNGVWRSPSGDPASRT